MSEKSKTDIPLVKVLEAIQPSNSGKGEPVLTYTALGRLIKEYETTHRARERKFWESESGTLNESYNARELAFEYFLHTAKKLIDADDTTRDIWADRYTQASIELYGEPDKEEVTNLITEEYQALLDLRGNEDISQTHLSILLEAYGPMLATRADSQVDIIDSLHEREAIHEYGKAILAKYKPIFDLVEESGKTEFSAKELHTLFEKALDWLKKNDDPDWKDWSIGEAKGNFIFVKADNMTINIPPHREAASAQEARGVLAHELLVHALRGKNGYKTGDKELATGVAGYLSAEEGLGILSEEAINGELPEKAYDRYVDIALALGSVDGVQKTRQEVFEISFARQIVRGQKNGTLRDTDISVLERKVWGHVDRIYRGSPGDNTNAKQGIFTKDIAYYVGYKLMAQYITEQMTLGKSASEIFEYLSQAKIEKTNKEHVARLNSAKS